MKCRNILLLIACLCFGCLLRTGQAKLATTAPLKFNQDGTFKIVQFTDMHWNKGEPKDLKTRQLMSDILDAEKPDLVILTGDNIGGKEVKDSAQAMRDVVKPMIERKIYWAAVLGNHDAEGTLSRTELVKLQMSMPYCLSELGPENISGAGNYILRIKSAAGDETKAVLYCIDTKANTDPNIIDGYDWISHDQIQWYLDTAEVLRKDNNGKPLPALAFFHIPLPEYNDVWNTNTCIGSKQEVVCCPKINSGFFSAMLQAGDVMATFCGHDHVNDYEGQFCGIWLCYGRASGFAPYGREGFPRGSRIIQLKEGVRDFETWLCVEDNKLIHRRKLCNLEQNEGKK